MGKNEAKIEEGARGPRASGTEGEYTELELAQVFCLSGRTVHSSVVFASHASHRHSKMSEIDLISITSLQFFAFGSIITRIRMEQSMTHLRSKCNHWYKLEFEGGAAQGETGTNL